MSEHTYTVELTITADIRATNADMAEEHAEMLRDCFYRACQRARPSNFVNVEVADVSFNEAS